MTMPRPNLPPGQQAVYDAMVEMRKRDLVWPTLRMIAEAIDRNHVTVYGHMQAMIHKGIVENTNEKCCRPYSIAPEYMPEPETIIIPIMGKIS